MNRRQFVVGTAATYGSTLLPVRLTLHKSPLRLRPSLSVAAAQQVARQSLLPRAAELNNLRSSIGLLRAQLGLGSYPWSEPIAPGMFVRQTHFRELQDSVNQTYVRLGAPPPTFSPGVVTISQTPQRLADIQTAISTMQSAPWFVPVTVPPMPKEIRVHFQGEILLNPPPLQRFISDVLRDRVIKDKPQRTAEENDLATEIWRKTFGDTVLVWAAATALWLMAEAAELGG